MNQFVAELFKTGTYKSKQGRIARISTAVAIFVILTAGIYQLYNSVLAGHGAFAVYGLPLILLAINAWFSYRVVNYSKFADFLIQVEAEMRKVSWPGKDELIRSSVVVIVVMLLLTVLLFGYDIILQFLFGKISAAMDFIAKALGIF